MARAKALRDLGDTDLLERLSDSKEELFNLRFQNATGQLDNPATIKQVKKDIARVRTELRAREITAAEDLEAIENFNAAEESEVADAPDPDADASSDEEEN